MSDFFQLIRMLFLTFFWLIFSLNNCRARVDYERVSRFIIFSTCFWFFLQQNKHRDISFRSTFFIMNSYYLIFFSRLNYEFKIISLSTILKLTFEFINFFCLFFLSHDFFSFAFFSFFYALIFFLLYFNFVERKIHFDILTL